MGKTVVALERDSRGVWEIFFGGKFCSGVSQPWNYWHSETDHSLCEALSCALLRTTDDGWGEGWCTVEARRGIQGSSWASGFPKWNCVISFLLFSVCWQLVFYINHTTCDNEAFKRIWRRIVCKKGLKHFLKSTFLRIKWYPWLSESEISQASFLEYKITSLGSIMCKVIIFLPSYLWAPNSF